MNAALDVFRSGTGFRKIDLWESLSKEKRPHLASFAAAVFIHLCFLLLGGLAFVKSAEYGIELNRGGVEVYLVAALPGETSGGAGSAGPVVPETNVSDMTVPAPFENSWKQDWSGRTRSSPLPKDFEHSGDGSAPAPGKDSTTFYSEGGGSSEAKPGYLKNPAPPYPAEAIEHGQEGLVMLFVVVDRTGRPRKVELQKSSGFRLLDQSASRTVRQWKFSPGRLGFLSSESELLIPIRFQLKDLK